MDEITVVNVNAKLYSSNIEIDVIKLCSSHVSVGIWHVYERHSLYVFKADSTKMAEPNSV